MELLGGIEERMRKRKRKERKRDEEAELGREEIGYRLKSRKSSGVGWNYQRGLEVWKRGGKRVDGRFL